MRLVSQDRIVDLPYEQVGLVLRSYNGLGTYEIMATDLRTGNTMARMGRYSSKDFAEKLMKILRDSYVLGWQVFEFSKDGSDLGGDA